MIEKEQLNDKLTAISVLKAHMIILISKGSSIMREILHSIYISDLIMIKIAIPLLPVVWSVISVVFYKWIRIISAICALLVTVVILYLTIFSRSHSSAGAEWIPFSSFERAKIQPELYRSMLMNIFLFVPFGLCVPFIFDGGVIKRMLLTLSAGFLLSATAEVIQYIASIGMAEADDVICNTIGAVIGSCAYPLTLLWRKLYLKDRKRRTPNE